jgi:hypothetical protein
MTALKLIITSKANLKLKYQNKFSALQKLFAKLVKADKKKKLDTKVVYIDDPASVAKFGIKAVPLVNEKNCKDAFDQLFKKQQPAYMVIFGAQDVFPFQELDNELYDPDPEKDNDLTVPSDLPYACESHYSKKLASFKDPARVVGRIPDLPKKGDIEYVRTLIEDNIRHKSVSQDNYLKNYFAVTALVWRKSTQESTQNIYGNFSKLLESPPAKGGYSKSQLAPLSHFYNCHGALVDTNYYGQQGSSFPTALASPDLKNKISYGTVVAAECCYGSQLLDPAESGLSIASNYLLNHALLFMGSSTIAYGPPSGQGLADLICQYFLINVHNGASAGRALLEARQKFLSENGPTFDAHELKTMGQFYLLGDPSLTLVKTEAPKEKKAMNTIENRRMNLLTKGISIGRSVDPCKKKKTSTKSRHQKEINAVLKETGFAGVKKEVVFETGGSAKGTGAGTKKALPGGKTRFRTYQKGKRKHKGIPNIEVLVVKENDQQMLGWKVYVSR